MFTAVLVLALFATVAMGLAAGSAFLRYKVTKDRKARRDGLLNLGSFALFALGTLVWITLAHVYGSAA